MFSEEAATSPQPAPVKPNALRSLKDILSHLSFEEAVKLLGGPGTDARKQLVRARFPGTSIPSGTSTFAATCSA